MCSLIVDASKIEMTAEEWPLERWVKEVAQEQLAGLEHGRQPNIVVPDCLMQEGPLRNSILSEYSFKAVSEKLATLGICQLATLSSSNADFEYWMGQIMDEARHTSYFRQHLVEMGLKDVDNEMVAMNEFSLREVIDPLQEYFDRYVLERKHYICGVAIITIVLEGVLAPTAELGERKWKPFDPQAALIQHNANLDELRHLTVCANIVREATMASEKIKKEVEACVQEGMQLWQQLPIGQSMMAREMDYQAGMEQYSHLVEGYMLDDNMPLLETTPEKRIELSIKWSNEMQMSRLNYMQVSL